jgi:HSP20 family protein
MAEPTVPTPAPTAAPTREPTRAEETFVPPPVDIYEDDQGLVVLVDLPGVEPSGLDVRVDRGILTIQGRAGHLASGDPVYREYQLTGFFRQFQLPEEVDTGRIAAELRNGVLTLRLPRAERAQPRRIEVRTG